MKSMPKPGVCRLGKGVTAGRTGFVARSRCTGKAVIGVTNWLSPKVSKPEMVWEVELNGKASAKPRSELRYSFKRNPLAVKVKAPSHVGLKMNCWPSTRFI